MALKVPSKELELHPEHRPDHSSSTTGVLCETCSQMLPRRLEGGPHHQTLGSLEAAAEAGCYICVRLLQFTVKTAGRHWEGCVREPFYYNQYEYRKPTPDYENLQRSTAELFIHAHVGMEGGSSAIDKMLLVVAPASATSLPARTSVWGRKSAIPLDEAVAQIERWMTACIGDHDGTACLKNTHPSFYPSRLLELGETTFRVVRTATERPYGPYVALSYCWGPNPSFLRLTDVNEKGLEAGMSISELPIAFREAIDIVRRLAYRYLWIDSLCILQSGPGSAEDWQRESALMYQVYSGSILTLALARAATPDESVLGGRPPDVTLPYEFHDDTTRPCTVIFPDYFRKALYDQALNERGWALQERVMAPRVVSFGAGELFWDCAQVSNASESIPGGLESILEPGDVAVSHFGLPDKSIPSNKAGYDALLKNWWSLLEEYTRRKITYPENDKLVAMSAIAMQMAKSINDVYIAGHFLKTLPSSLDWGPWARHWRQGLPERRKLSGSVSTKDESKVNLAPTWSWASMDSPICCYTPWTGASGTLLAEVESYTLKLADENNPTGPCIFASLTIRGYCMEIRWERGGYMGFTPTARSVEWCCKNLCSCHFEPDHCEFSDLSYPDGTVQYVLVIHEEKEYLRWSGIVVERVPLEAETRYRRVGHFEVFGRVRSEDTRSRFWDDRFSICGDEKMLMKLV
ncbi:HET-domain-containing protein [Diaporthe amygdali]|uniref:HET-domain-containing protein n=1 Tax=Phomopsis amygdali TaxID=1214568 RepID=UPI0022FE7262|nr:HET-domain-containing protein [Diaporthe amygdali]KAJ0122401.1 HET-domain-containing protein [Diaporthe amygdali]